MQRYFVSALELENNNITNPNLIHHLENVVGIKVKDIISLSDNDKAYKVEIQNISKSTILFSKKELIMAVTELPFFITLFQALPKQDKFEEIIKNNTQFGVNEFVGVITSRVIVKIDPKKLDAKIARYNAICENASSQSGRSKIPTFRGIFDYQKIDFSSYDYLILCNEESAKSDGNYNLFKIINELKPNSKIGIMVGCEGGISDKEITYFEDKGFVSCSLGPRILRCENAAMYVLSNISFRWELGK